MRRFLAFVMCVSGFTLAVSWARADEPAAAPADDEATSSEVATPSARPEIVRTEPGEYRRERGETPADASGTDSPAGLAERPSSLPSAADYLRWQLQSLQEAASRLNDRYSGEVLERFRARFAAEAARIQKQQAGIQQGNPELELEIVEQQLGALIGMAERLPADAAESARQTLERQVDEIEHYLAERRARRDGVGDRPQPDAARDQPAPPEGDPAMRELHEKVRHLSAALEHLRAAGFEDLARETERRVLELQLTIAQQQARRRAAEAREHREESVDPQPVHRAIEELTNQVGELRRELRRLRSEVDQLRQKHSEPDDAPSDREPDEPDGERSDV